MRSPFRGFSLLEVLVAIAIIAVLTAVVLPSLSNKLRDSRTAALSQTLQGISQGVAEFKRATTRYPSTLGMLVTATGATSLDICGTQLSTTPSSLWRGPYLTRDVPSGGIAMGDAVIQTALGKVMNASGTAPLFILINANGVESSTVDALESTLDGGTADAANGTIRWVAGSSTSERNVSYAIPVSSC